MKSKDQGSSNLKFIFLAHFMNYLLSFVSFLRLFFLLQLTF
jgi:hypothetical protein